MPPLLYPPPYFKFRYHGNYVGPGWSAGKYQASVVRSNVQPVDEFDATAKEHDASYARGKKLKSADYKFYRSNIGKGWKRSLAAIAVGTQGYFRNDDEKEIIHQKKKLMSRGRTAYRTPSVSRLRSVSMRGRTVSRSRSMSAPKKRIVSLVVRKRRNGGAMPGVASGKVKFLPKKVKRYLKKFNASVDVCRESSGSLSSKTCNYLGHGTGLILQIYRSIGMCLVKHAFNQYDIFIRNFSDTIGDYTNSSVIYSINYYLSPRVVGQTGSVSSSYTSATVFLNLSNDIGNTMRQLVCDNPEIQFNAIRFDFLLATTPAVNKTVQIDLRFLTFEYKCKSSLKMQNRSRNSLGTEADEVDNVPLNGRSYETSGTGFTYLDFNRRAIANVPFIIDPISGVITYNGDDDATNNLKEPPKAKFFLQSKYSGKLVLEPGHIKTSILTETKRMSLEKLVLLSKGDFTSLKVLARIGKSRMFALEKMISTNDGVAELATSVFFENNYDLNVKIAVDNRQATVPVVYLTGGVS